MNFLNLDALSLALVFAVFIAASGLVWFAGTRLSQYADRLADRTGIGHAVIGALLLGGITSLPEVATTVTASSMGDAKIAINNLFGGVALQVTVLVIGDIALGKRSLSSALTSDVIRLQGIVGILTFAIAVAVMVVGDRAILHVGIGSVLVLLTSSVGFSLITYLESIRWWESEEHAPKKEPSHDNEDSAVERHGSAGKVLRSNLFLKLLGAAAAVLVGGFVVVISGEAIASRTGIGSSVVGAALVALSTSLPEVSTTVAAIRLKEYNMAFANILGTNIFDGGLVFIADLFYRKGPILNEVGNFSIFAAVLGITLTTVYLLGLLVRYQKTLLRMGYDSIVVLVLYLSGLYLMISVLQN